MPEGPIIIILKEELQQFKHKEVIAANGYTPNLDPDILIGQKLIDIKSWGKHLLLCFPKFTIRVHLMLFGSWRINSRGKKNASLGLEFPNGEVNFYISSIVLIETPLDEVYDWQADVMSDEWDTEKTIEKLKQKPKAFIGDVLLDQKIFSGVGNIIRNEAMFRARIHPQSMVGAIPDKKLHQLINETVKYSFDFLKWKKERVLRGILKPMSRKCARVTIYPFRKLTWAKQKDILTIVTFVRCCMMGMINI